jgi:hypothetical protein
MGEHLEGCGCGLIEVVSQKLFGQLEGNHEETQLRIVSVPAEIRTVEYESRAQPLQNPAPYPTSARLKWHLYVGPITKLQEKCKLDFEAGTGEERERNAVSGPSGNYMSCIMNRDEPCRLSIYLSPKRLYPVTRAHGTTVHKTAISVRKILEGSLYKLSFVVIYFE